MRITPNWDKTELEEQMYNGHEPAVLPHDFTNQPYPTTDPTELKQRAMIKEFQIKKLVELTRHIPNLNVHMFTEAVQLAGELVQAELDLQNAKYKVQSIKANLARLVG